MAIRGPRGLVDFGAKVSGEAAEETERFAERRKLIPLQVELLLRRKGVSGGDAERIKVELSRQLDRCIAATAALSTAGRAIADTAEEVRRLLRGADAAAALRAFDPDK